MHQNGNLVIWWNFELDLIQLEGSDHECFDSVTTVHSGLNIEY